MSQKESELEEYKKYLETVVIEKPYAFFCTNCSFKWVFGLDADIHSQTTRHKVIYYERKRC